MGITKFRRREETRDDEKIDRIFKIVERFLALKRSIEAMVLRLSRRTFSQLPLACIIGCDDDASRLAAPAPLATVAIPPISAVVPTVAPIAREPELPLFQKYPLLARRIRHVRLGDFPTPVDRAEKLGLEIGVSNLWIKRDDISGKLYGGGKTRKLEFYLADARSPHVREIVTFGAYGSNQAVATALWGKSAGFSVRVVLAPQMPSAYVKTNLFALRKTGTTIELALEGLGAAEQKWTEKARIDKEQSFYIIPAGGSSPLGNTAFINAALELVDQIKAGVCPLPDCIYMAMGTMGSIVGMVIGLRIAEIESEIVAVRASSAETSSESRFWSLVEETMRFLRARDPSFPEVKVDRRRVRFQTHQLGGGYGFATRQGTAAMTIFERTLGYALEPTYTAKAMAALIADTKRLANKTVLFWNSHNTQKLSTDGVIVEDFPRDLQNYLRRPL